MDFSNKRVFLTRCFFLLAFTVRVSCSSDKLCTILHLAKDIISSSEFSCAATMGCNVLPLFDSLTAIGNDCIDIALHGASLNEKSENLYNQVGYTLIHTMSATLPFFVLNSNFGVSTHEKFVILLCGAVNNMNISHKILYSLDKNESIRRNISMHVFAHILTLFNTFKVLGCLDVD